MENYEVDFIRKISDFTSLPYSVFSTDDTFIIDNHRLKKIEEYTELLDNIYKSIDFLYRNEDIDTLTKALSILERDIENIKSNVKELQNDNKTFIASCLNIKIEELESFREKIETYIDSIEITDAPHINNTKDINRPLTNHEIALFFFYLFKELNLDEINYKKTKATEIIYKIMGLKKSQKDIVNTNIYKILKNPFTFYKTKREPDSMQLQANLRTVKSMFESLGINTNKIEGDIRNY